VRSSLRRALSFAIIGVTGPTIALCAFLLYQRVSSTIWRAFDRDLVASARVLAELAERDEGGYEFELGPSVTRVAGAKAPLYFQAWLPDGALLARSPSLGDDDLPRLDGTTEQPSLRTHTLADGTRVRVTGFAFAPRDDEPELGEPASPTSGAGMLSLSVARDTAATASMLDRLALWFLGIGAVIVLLSSWLVGALIARGLRPIERVASEIEHLDHSVLDTRISVADCPAELRPLVAELNHLLGRLESAFTRERRFTADAAHELRTPLAILRTEAELGLARERAPEKYREILQRVLDTTVETAVMVENLLTLARADASRLELTRATVGLRELVAETWRPLADAASARDLGFDNEVAEGVSLDTDREKLRLVIANLLANAVQYTAPGGRISVAARPGDGIVLEVCNTAAPIPDSDLPRVFERFWRADAARSDAGLHCGLGLALVASLCKHLGYRVTAGNRADGVVCFTVAEGEPHGAD